MTSEKPVMHHTFNQSVRERWRSLHYTPGVALEIQNGLTVTKHICFLFWQLLLLNGCTHSSRAFHSEGIKFTHQLLALRIFLLTQGQWTSSTGHIWMQFLHTCPRIVISTSTVVNRIKKNSSKHWHCY